jgi:uncharacterized protein YgiM (DUF1202 family)
MNAELYLIWAKIAGIGGAAIGLLALIFRAILWQRVFPRLDRKRAFVVLTLIVVFAGTSCLAGIGAWYLIETKSPTPGLLYRVRHVQAGDTLKVRVGPGANSDVIVEIPPDSRDIQVNEGSWKAPDGGVWVRITYKRVEGWVNSYYLQSQ